MTHRPRHSGGTPGASGPPGRNYPVSKPTPFVDKRVTKNVSTSDVATGKFTGGIQRVHLSRNLIKLLRKKLIHQKKQDGKQQ